MSADNAIAILNTPAHPQDQTAERHYRVAHVGAPSNLVDPEIDPARLNRLLLNNFAGSEVYSSEEQARSAASIMAEQIRHADEVLEYGIITIKLEQPFPG
jgi:hypothetical protein